ncbi:MAG: hypothetical protein ACR2QC_10720 [Gammaproteobacteria bacterium]
MHIFHRARVFFRPARWRPLRAHRGDDLERRDITPRRPRRLSSASQRPIPAKAGISAAAKRRVIVILVIYNLRLRRRDSCLRRNGNEIPAFAGMAVFFRRNGVFYIFGYRQIWYCPQRQKVPAIPAKAGISLIPFLRRQESHRRRR